ncbi:MAG: hypothetical protein IJM30_04475 [Thermoguttaceae bacterium]|nr:hypothetical protein [Thermoguttaceae bacterium]
MGLIDEMIEKGFRKGYREGFREGYRKGLRKGSLRILYKLFNDGELTLARAAEVAGKSEDEFQREAVWFAERAEAVPA